MLYIIALILLGSLVTATCLIGYTTNRLDSKLTQDDAKNRIHNTQTHA